jgi:hypothetical protein
MLSASWPRSSITATRVVGAGQRRSVVFLDGYWGVVLVVTPSPARRRTPAGTADVRHLQQHWCPGVGTRQLRGQNTPTPSSCKQTHCTCVKGAKQARCYGSATKLPVR